MVHWARRFAFQLLGMLMCLLAASAWAQLEPTSGSHLQLWFPQGVAQTRELVVQTGRQEALALQLQYRDADGQLLSTHSLVASGVLRVPARSMPARTRSLQVTAPMDSGASLRVAEFLPGARTVAHGARELDLTSANIANGPIRLFNPGDVSALVTVEGAQPGFVYLKPKAHATVLRQVGRAAVQLTSSEDIVVQSGPVGTAALGFREPVDSVYVPPYCELNGTCAGGGVSRHTGRDYMARPTSAATNYPTVSVAYGRVKRTIDYTDMVGCGSPSCDMGNIVVVEHVLTSGARWLSLHAHLNSKNFADGDVNGRIAKGQSVGIIGCSGRTLTLWCDGNGGNRHNHFEVKRPDLGTSDLWPYGYMTDGEAGTKGYTSASAAVSALFTTVPALQSTGAQILLPWFSRSTTSPGSSNYDTYGVAGSPLNTVLPLKPPTNTTYSSVGVGGSNLANNATADVFLCATATVGPTSAALSRSSASCASPSGNASPGVGDYSFYAYSGGSNGFGRGYELKFSVLPANSHLVDNDGLLSNTSGDTSTANRLGYYVGDEGGATDVPGYYLSAKLFTAGSSNFARWFAASAGSYEVWVHVPKGATATSVPYKIYPKGRPADGSCSSSHATNPCYSTDAISHAANQDSWVRLSAGSQTSFDFIASSANGAYVGLAAATATGGSVGADAVKFLPGAQQPPTEFTVAASVSPGSVNQWGTMTFTGTASGDVTKVSGMQVAFLDTTPVLVEALTRVGTSNQWSKSRTMGGVGNNRPYEIRATSTSGGSTTARGTYTVVAAGLSVAASANPATVHQYENITFTGTVSGNAALVSKAELVFRDVTPNIIEPMTRIGSTNQWARTRSMGGVGNNRPYEVRVTTTAGAVVSAPGTYTVLPLSAYVSNVSPLTGAVGTTANVQVTGTGLPPTLIINIAGQSSGCTAISRTSTLGSFSCPLDLAGSHMLEVKTNTAAQGGTVITTRTFVVSQGSAIVTSVLPLAGNVGTTATVTVQGSGLPPTLIININAQSTGCTPISRTSTQGIFSCPLDTPGNQELVVKTNTAAQGGTVITTRTFVVSQGSSGVTDVSPLSGYAGTTANVTVTGSGLPLTLIININGQSQGCTPLFRSSSQGQFSCPLDLRGSRLLEVKTNTAANGGTVMTTRYFNVY